MKLLFTHLPSDNQVMAVQCGHSGTVFSLFGTGKKADFDEGDWYVEWPENIIGEKPVEVIENARFSKEFKELNAQIKWAELGWRTK